MITRQKRFRGACTSLIITTQSSQFARDRGAQYRSRGAAKFASIGNTSLHDAEARRSRTTRGRDSCSHTLVGSQLDAVLPGSGIYVRDMLRSIALSPITACMVNRLADGDQCG